MKKLNLIIFGLVILAGLIAFVFAIQSRQPRLRDSYATGLTTPIKKTIQPGMIEWPTSEDESKRINTMLGNLRPPVQTSLTIVASSEYQSFAETDIEIKHHERGSADNGLVIEPNEGGNIGELTVHIYGFEFPEDVDIRLAKSGETDIVGKIVKVEDSNKSLYATFDLKGSSKGQWGLKVIDSQKKIMLSAGNFYVVEGIEPELEIKIVGPEKIALNESVKYRFVYKNTGNVDRAGAHIGIQGFPKTGTIGGDFGFYVSPLNLPLEATDNTLSYDDSGDCRNISFNLLTIPGSFTGSLMLEITVTEAAEFTIKALGI